MSLILFLSVMQVLQVFHGLHDTINEYENELKQSGFSLDSSEVISALQAGKLSSGNGNSATDEATDETPPGSCLFAYLHTPRICGRKTTLLVSPCHAHAYFSSLKRSMTTQHAVEETRNSEEYLHMLENLASVDGHAWERLEVRHVCFT